MAKDRQISVKYNNDLPDTFWIMIDPMKFPWVISNLLSNALRVSKPKSEVQINLSEENGIIILNVIDQGPGISEGIRDKIFDPYFQDTTHKDQNLAGFLGLGLSIVKEIVEVHDGMIEYFPNHPAGSIFRVSLPALYS
jgi:K+-sensing histidine kinase KdpD